ncbi:FtsX-like permease family protein [Feifania hominis]|uniref:FtsX-like permease family protein n=1 Tax=Feifania hominis TaxID=2763660 RepID=A0A926DCK1_9FIRM|nr:FtsX-like permease family protein [Feifania hominis]
MSRSFLKDIFREIWKTRTRFLSIFAIVALGVGFFAGIKATGPDMKLTADTFFKENNLMDMRLVSTYGFTEDDVQALRSLSVVEGLMPSYSVDAVVTGDGAGRVVRLHAYPETRGEGDPDYINRPVLKAGRYPEKPGECLIEANGDVVSGFTGGSKSGLSIGDVLELESGDSENPITDSLRHSSYTIVGMVESPYYISFERGNTTIGSGSVTYYAMLPESEFKTEVYTEVYLTVRGTADVKSYEQEYAALLKKARVNIEAVGERREIERYEEIVAEAREKIDDAKLELADGEKTQQEELSKARRELDDAREELRDGERELADAQREFDEKIADAEQQLADARQELADGETEYADGVAEYEKGLAEYNEGVADFEEGRLEYLDAKAKADIEIPKAEAEIADAERQIYEAVMSIDAGWRKVSAGWDEIAANEEKLRQGQTALEQGQQLLASLRVVAAAPTAVSDEQAAAIVAGASAYEPTLGAFVQSYIEQAKAGTLDPGAAVVFGGMLDGMETQLDTQQQTIDRGWTEINSARSQLESAARSLESGERELKKAREELAEGKAELEENKKKLDDARIEIEDAERELSEAKTELDDAKKKLADARQELDDGYVTLAEKTAEFEDEKARGESELKKARNDLAEGRRELADGEREYEDGKRESDQEIADAKAEIADAEQELAELKTPVWYYYDRSDNAGAKGYYDNADRINAIAQIFPLFFLVVAALVCLTTMTRMVEEQRTQIGTVKALGYGKFAIASKYVLYAVVASLLGSAVGLAVGFWLFPTVIFNAYGIMYQLPDVLTPFHGGLALISTAAAVACTVVSALAACYRELATEPAQLMRPKAPKAGKRIFLERIGFLWNHLGFIQKVTARNLFRYKKRMLMTVVGIAGCAALMLTGFGVKDSINDIIAVQFDEIFHYDLMVILNDEQDGANEVRASVERDDRVGSSMLMLQDTYDAVADTGTMEVNLFVPQSGELLGQFVTMRERRSETPVAFDDTGAVITEKLATQLDLSPGDRISLRDSTGKSVEVPISGVMENYTYHYVFLSPALYESCFGEPPAFNGLTITMADGHAGEQEALSKDLLLDDAVLTATSTADIRDQFGDVIRSLDMVVIVLIVAAGALAFVVLYNLTNINVTERIREIATIKVLGFYDREVSAYVYRENMALTLIGTVAGLFGGVLLHHFVIVTAEIDIVMFGRQIQPMSYLYAAVMTFVFAIVVNLVMHQRLKKVSMVESLKSVE